MGINGNEEYIIYCDTLEEYKKSLMSNPKISFRSGKKIQSIELTEENKIKVVYKRDNGIFDYAVHCSEPRHLQDIKLVKVDSSQSDGNEYETSCNSLFQNQRSPSSKGQHANNSPSLKGQHVNNSW